MKFLLVMIGGAVGSAFRFEAGRLTLRWLGPNYPWGILSVNLIGGFLMGVLAGVIVAEGRADRTAWLLLGVGMLGGFTTFSSFSLDVFNMLNTGRPAAAIGYIALSVVGSILLLWAGYALTRALV